MPDYRCTCAGTAPGFSQHESFCGKDVDDYAPQNIWTVEARLLSQWSVWSSWIDYSTAVNEQIAAQRDGFTARIVRAT